LVSEQLISLALRVPVQGLVMGFERPQELLATGSMHLVERHRVMEYAHERPAAVTGSMQSASVPDMESFPLAELPATVFARLAVRPLGMEFTLRRQPWVMASTQLARARPVSD